MLSKLVDAMFGCWHTRYTFPITVRGYRRGAAAQTGTYVVCLDCGKELPYNWQEMRIVSSDDLSGPRVRALATKEAA